MKQTRNPSDGPPLGLTSEQASHLQSLHGKNELPQPKSANWFQVLARQFTSILVVILYAAAALAIYLGESIDAIAIGLVVVLNGFLGFVQEWRAENAIKSLRKMLSPTAQVLRDGRFQTIPAIDLVPEDLVILATGNRVPADLALQSVQHLSIDESLLTGESLPVNKSISDSTAMLFAGRPWYRVTGAAL